MFCYNTLSNYLRQDFRRLSATNIFTIAKMTSKVKTSTVVSRSLICLAMIISDKCITLVLGVIMINIFFNIF